MEELRSTAILDKEIQDDARRKADKILKASDLECLQIAQDVSARISRVQEQKEKEYAKKLEAYLRDSSSAIPLEKQRRLVQFLDVSVQDALDTWFSDIGAEKRLSLLTHFLEKYAKILAGRTLNVSYRGYRQEEIQTISRDLFGAQSIASVTELSASQASEAGFSDGMILETAEKDIVCRATLTEIRQDLLSNRRQELAEALFGGRLPE